MCDQSGRVLLSYNGSSYNYYSGMLKEAYLQMRTKGTSNEAPVQRIEKEKRDGTNGEGGAVRTAVSKIMRRIDVGGNNED
jgi:hypothetical protein